MAVVPSQDLAITNALASIIQRLDLLFEMMSELAIEETIVEDHPQESNVWEECRLCGNGGWNSVEHKPNCPISRYVGYTALHIGK